MKTEIEQRPYKPDILSLETQPVQPHTLTRMNPEPMQLSENEGCFKALTSAIADVILHADKHVELKKRADKLGVDFGTFKTQPSTKVTWDDGGRLMKQQKGGEIANDLGLPTEYAELMLDTNAVSVDPSTAVFLCAFNTTYKHANFTVKAKHVVVGKNKDGTNITMYSEKHMRILANMLWQEWMIQNKKSDQITNPSPTDRKVRNKWYKDLMKQKGEGASSIDETTNVIIYKKFFMTMGNTKKVDMYFHTKMYSDSNTMQIQHTCVGSNHSVILKDKYRERDMAVGHVDYEKGMVVKAFCFEKTDVTFDEAKARMSDRNAVVVEDDMCNVEEVDGKIELHLEQLPLVLGEAGGEFCLPVASMLTMQMQMGPATSRVQTKGCGVIRCVSRGGGGRTCLVDVEVDPEVPPLEFFTTNVKISDEVVGTLEPLTTKIEEHYTPRLNGRFAVLTLNLLVMVTPPEGHFERINEDFGASLLSKVVDAVEILQRDIESIPEENRETYAPIDKQKKAQFVKGPEANKLLAASIRSHDGFKFKDPMALCDEDMDKDEDDEDSILIADKESGDSMQTEPRVETKCYEEKISHVITVDAMMYCRDDETCKPLGEYKGCTQTPEEKVYYMENKHADLKLTITNTGMCVKKLQLFYSDSDGEELETTLELKSSEEYEFPYALNVNQSDGPCEWKLKDMAGNTHITYKLLDVIVREF